MINLNRLLVCCFAITAFFAVSSPVFADVPRYGNTSETTLSSSGTTDNSDTYFLDEYAEPEVFAQSQSPVRSVISFSWKLLLVLGLLYLTVRGLRFLYRNKLGVEKSGNSFTLLDTFYIKPNQAMYIVEIVGRFFVLGVTNYNFTVICEITDEGAVASLRKQNSGEGAGARFQKTFASILGKNASPLDSKIAESSKKILDQIQRISTS